MNERTLQQNGIKYAKKLGVLVYKFASPARRGVPDLILIGQGGRVEFAELKSPTGNGRLSELQKHEIKILKNQGVRVHVIDSIEHFKYVIEALASNSRSE